MKKIERALILVGSPKIDKSSSNSLADYLIKKLDNRIPAIEKLYLLKSILSEEYKTKLIESVANTDLIILLFPLYTDGVTAITLKAFELIAEHRKKINRVTDQRFIALSNSGFPESSQNETALEICRCFADKMGMKWYGGLALGGGGAIGGQDLESLGGMMKNARKSLDLTAEALILDNPIPQEAKDIMAKPFIPCWLYMLIGEYGMKRMAKKNGVKEKLFDQPYLSE